ncbi:MAG: glycosyltransferase [Magnetococcales bacterium]|nr:glycosyltransferase [Magnetococcales bacterium]MBF0322687.1 glycosyltransferase [Magnetococcales bacterium]
MSASAAAPDISVVIPVYNEELVLPRLFERLYPALEALRRSYEVVFIDDGSRDASVALLHRQFLHRPEVTRVVVLKSNFGQHAAILAGFAHTRGHFVITLDADLQNPPEEIHKLVAKLDEGYDYVGSIRRQRRDRLWRHVLSRLMNRLREKITRIHMTDQGCMLRGYDRAIIDVLRASQEVTTYIPALAFLYAGRPTEVMVEHEERELGQSKYSLFRLIQLNFDLMTGFSTAPLRIFSLGGIVISCGSLFFVLYLAIRRLMIGPEAEGVFTLFAIAYFLIGITLFGIGLMGEYMGRIYHQTLARPRYLVRTVLEHPSAATGLTPAGVNPDREPAPR